MNNFTKPDHKPKAFTLIELLVVIAVIALLAALIFPVTATVNRQKVRTKARAELDAVAMAIEGYKDKLGFYPPGNTNNYAQTALFYELAGTTKQGNTYQTLDKSSTITQQQLVDNFGVTGLVNSSAGGDAGEGQNAQRFLGGTRPYPTATLQAGQDPATSPKVLVTSVGWKFDQNPLMPNNAKVSPVYYNSANPTNSTHSYDLWVDVIAGDKTNRISNWSKEPSIP